MPVLQNKIIKEALKKKGLSLKRAKYYERRLDDTKAFFDHCAGSAAYQIAAAAQFNDLRNMFNYPATHSVIAKAITGRPGAKLLARLAEFIDHVNDIDTSKSKSLIGPYIAAMTAAHPGPNYEDPSATEVNALYTTNTMTRHGVNMITRNFIDRLKLFFDRLYLDWKDINDLFFPDYVLVQLANITITDSDSHKKGAHVLILTFEAAPLPTLGPAPAPVTGWRALFSRGPRNNQLDQRDLPKLRLVYKPGDLELDYRILANTVETANRLGAPRTPLPVTPHGSLLEVCQPAANFLPTYFILPRYSCSGAALRVDGSAPIDEAYGYIQFLDHEPERGKAVRKKVPELDDNGRKRRDDRGEVIMRNAMVGTDGDPLKLDSYGNKLDWATCDPEKLDWITLNNADIQPFLEIFGWYMAIGLTFSLNDSHAENVMVHKRKPYLIDVEISFKSPTINIFSTMLDSALIGVCNGVSGDAYFSQLYYLPARDQRPISVLRMNNTGATPNAVTLASHGHHAHNFQHVRNGFDAAIAHMTGIQGALNNWLNDAGLQNTFCRYTAEGTATYWGIYRTLYGQTYCLSAGPPPAIPAPPPPQFGPAVTYGETLGAAWYRREPFQSELCKRIKLFDDNTATRPNWSTMTFEHGAADLVNTDVAMFYHRVNSRDLINARGFTVSCAPLAIADFPPLMWAVGNPPVALTAVPFNTNMTAFNLKCTNHGVNYLTAAAVGATFAAAQVARLSTPAMNDPVTGIKRVEGDRLVNYTPTTY